MTVAEQLAVKRRRQAILALLFFLPGQAASVRALRDDLETAHGQVVSVDIVRVDCLWLAEVGYARVNAGMVQLTEAGREIVMGRREFA